MKNKLVFALPKGNRIRSVPMSPGVAKELRAHIKEFPPVAITLPWGTADREPRTAVSSARVTGKERSSRPG